jgi:hypothetical protein
MALNKKVQTEATKKAEIEAAKVRAKEILRSKKQKNDQTRQPPPQKPSDEVRL